MEPSNPSVWIASSNTHRIRGANHPPSHNRFLSSEGPGRNGHQGIRNCLAALSPLPGDVCLLHSPYTLSKGQGTGSAPVAIILTCSPSPILPNHSASTSASASLPITTEENDARGGRLEWRSDNCACRRSRRNSNSSGSVSRGRTTRAHADGDLIRQQHWLRNRGSGEWRDHHHLLICLKRLLRWSPNYLVSPPDTHILHTRTTTTVRPPADTTGHGDLCSSGARVCASL